MREERLSKEKKDKKRNSESEDKKKKIDNRYPFHNDYYEFDDTVLCKMVCEEEPEQSGHFEKQIRKTYFSDYDQKKYGRGEQGYNIMTRQINQAELKRMEKYDRRRKKYGSRDRGSSSSSSRSRRHHSRSSESRHRKRSYRSRDEYRSRGYRGDYNRKRY